METPTATPAAPAAPSDPVIVSSESLIDSLSSTERSTWQQSGDLPDRVRVRSRREPSSDVSAASSAPSTDLRESSPATPVDQAASTDAQTKAPASEPGQPPEKGAKLKARNAELDAENAQLQERLKLRKALREELKSLERPADAKTPESSPAADQRREWDGIVPNDPKPQDVDFDHHNDYLDARDAWNERRIERKLDARSHADAEVRDQVGSIQSIAKTAAERIAKFQEATPGFAEQVDPRLLDIETASVRRLKGEKVGPQHLLAEHVLKSEAVGDLLTHFSTPAGQREWQSLVSLNPFDLLVAFGRIESRFDPAKPSAPAPKTVSTAPAPPMTLGTRTADTADPLEAAIKRKDTSAYIREANKRELAALGL